jgi:hypothetical protein
MTASLRLSSFSASARTRAVTRVFKLVAVTGAPAPGVPWSRGVPMRSESKGATAVLPKPGGCPASGLLSATAASAICFEAASCCRGRGGRSARGVCRANADRR